MKEKIKEIIEDLEKLLEKVKGLSVQSEASQPDPPGTPPPK